MMAPANPSDEAELRRQLATLTLAEVEPSGPVEAISSVAWWNMLARLGLPLPLVVVHDLGHLLVKAKERVPHRLTALARGGVPATRTQYRALLAAVATSDLAAALGVGPMRDETVAVVLARAL